MASALIAIGDELVGGFTLDTNSNWLAARLRHLGFPVRRITQIRDAEAEIVEQVRRDLDDPAITDIFCSGGLGPTPDDRTWAALAIALGRPLAMWGPARSRIERRVQQAYEAGRIPSPLPTDANLRMARIPANPTHVFVNRVGMAPGALYTIDSAAPTRIFVLPGVPAELKGIFSEGMEPEFLAGGVGAIVRELHFKAAPESQFSPLMRELARTHPEVSVGSYPNLETRELTIRCLGPDQALVEEAIDIVRRASAELGFIPGRGPRFAGDDPP